ncbi:MAG: hypothetical protein ACI85F_000451 [Bacteroidia bacterium]|jgi:uncharacterized protein with PIN domain
MFLATIDFLDVAFFVVRQLLVITIIYVVIILVIRVSGYYELNKCPECGHRLKRSSRSSTEHLAKRFSFGILPLKRYRCYSCYWEGAAFQIHKSGSEPTPKENESIEEKEPTKTESAEVKLDD